ncbi:MAG: NEW3 domain-containing protein [Candidatus Micrarchaeota archaeon]
MKNTNMVFLALAAMLAVCALSFASLNPKLELAGYSVSEAPAQPGHVLNLTLHIRSMESDNCADNVAVQLSMAYPMSLQGPDTQYAESLCSTDWPDGGYFSFLIPIDPLAQSGTYPITLSTTYEKRFSKFSESNTLNIRVGGDPSFDAVVSSSNPQDIYAGDSATITITLHNAGSSQAQSVFATLSAPPELEVKWAGQTQSLGSISSRSSANAQFLIEAQKNAPAGNYPLTLNLQYQKEDKGAANASFTFMLPIKPKAEFDANALVDSPLSAGEDRTVHINFTNTGSKEARHIKVSIKPIYPFSTDGTVRYIESLMPGQSADIVYEIHTDKDGNDGDEALSLVENFEDSQGKKFSDTQDFMLPVRTKSLIDKALEFWYFGALIVLLGGVIIAKKRRAKKE